MTLRFSTYRRTTVAGTAVHYLTVNNPGIERTLELTDMNPLPGERKWHGYRLHDHVRNLQRELEHIPFDFWEEGARVHRLHKQGRVYTLRPLASKAGYGAGKFIGIELRQRINGEEVVVDQYIDAEEDLADFVCLLKRLARNHVTNSYNEEGEVEAAA